MKGVLSARKPFSIDWEFGSQHVTLLDEYGFALTVYHQDNITHVEAGSITFTVEESFDEVMKFLTQTA